MIYAGNRRNAGVPRGVLPAGNQAGSRDMNEERIDKIKKACIALANDCDMDVRSIYEVILLKHNAGLLALALENEIRLMAMRRTDGWFDTTGEE
jgi:hypothetical protein